MKQRPGKNNYKMVSFFNSILDQVFEMDAWCDYHLFLPDDIVKLCWWLEVEEPDDATEEKEK